MHDPLHAYRAAEQEIPAMLSERGLVLLEGIEDASQLRQLVQSIAAVVSHRDSDAEGVTTITDLGSRYECSGFVGFTARALKPHTDGSSAANPPAW